MSKKIFISYRRDDTRYQARRIYDSLRQVLPSDYVFMDIDSISPGVDFRKVLKGWVDECEILLALIGPEWHSTKDSKTGRQRLENPSDFVRIEIGEALARDIPVVPVLIDGASIPDVDLLPNDLQQLVGRQAECIEFRTFDSDVERLICKLRLSEKSDQSVDLIPDIDAVNDSVLEVDMGDSADKFFNKPKKTNTTEIAGSENTVVLETTKGRVVIEMRPDLAPEHVNRIKELTREGFYDGIKFHRVIPDFMAQTGCPHGTGMGGSDRPDLKAEFSAEPHVRGTVSMARALNPDSANSQFFICFVDTPFLDNEYTVWGQVIDGMDNIDKIKQGEPVRDPDEIVSMKVAADV